MVDQFVVPFEQRQYRTYMGDQDEVYMNMATCRDKTVLAVNKWRLTREEQLLAALHDIDVRVLEAEGVFDVMAPIDLASHELYEFRKFQGSFDAKYRMMHIYLDNRMEVYVQTIHPRLSFAAYYYPELKISDYPRYNHIFSILGKDNGRYVYLDNGALQSRWFVPYEKNKELGVCGMDEIDQCLREKFDLSVVIWNEKKKAQLSEYPFKILQDYCRNRGNGMVDIATGRKLLTGLDAIQCMHNFFAHLEIKNLNTKSQFGFLSRNEILCWRIDDLAKRRNLLSMCVKKGMLDVGRENNTLVDQLDNSWRLWDKLKIDLMYYMKSRGKASLDFSRNFEEIIVSERNLKTTIKNVL